MGQDLTQHGLTEHLGIDKGFESSKTMTHEEL